MFRYREGLAKYTADSDQSAFPVFLAQVVLSNSFTGTGAVNKITLACIQCRMQSCSAAASSKHKNISPAHRATADAVSGIGLIIGNPRYVDAMLPVRPPDKSRAVKPAWCCPT